MSSACKVISKSQEFASISHSSSVRSSKCFMLFCIVLCVVVLGAGAALAQSPAPAKFTSASLPLGSPTNAAYSLAAGDFNGDSKQDLVVISPYNPPSANILLGNGDGTFSSPTQIPLHLRSGGGDIWAHNSNVVAVGDFKGDGRLDFAVYIAGAGPTNYLDVYLGDGTGNFSFSNSYTVGTPGKGWGYGTSVLAVDVNGDGTLDLVADNQGDNTVTVLLGNGDGTFQNGVLYPACNFAGCSPINLAVGDFNKDGHPDLALPDSGSGGGIDILLNNGDGTFQGPVFYAAVSGGEVPGGFIMGESGIAAADLNRDGKLDIVMTADSGAWVFLGNGDGTFQTAKNYPFAHGDSVTIADLNGDKKLDLVAADYQDSTVFVLLGNGNGTFKPAVAYATDWNPQSVVLADFNGDAKLDFAVGSDNGWFVTVALGNGDGTFSAGTNYDVYGNWGQQVVGDFNKDSNLDVAVTDGYQIQVMLGSSHGILGPPITTSFSSYGGPQITALAAGDVNGDGKPDLVAGVVINPDIEIAVLLGKDTGQFNAPVFYSTGIPNGYNTAPVSVSLADLNHDAKLDVLVTNQYGDLIVFLNKGKGVFGAATVISDLNAGYLATGDFNRDGRLDLVVNDWADNSLKMLLGNGDGTFQSPVAIPINHNPEWVAVGDFNKDGKLDLATGGQGVGNFSYGNGIGILLGNGDGSFGAPTYYTMYQGWSPYGAVGPGPAAVADVNLDGNPDMVFPFYLRTHIGPPGACCGGPDNIGIGIFLGNGDGTFEFENALGQPGVIGGPFLVGTGSYGVLTGDFNNDGAPDAAVLNMYNFAGSSGSAYVTMLLNATQPVSVSPLSVTFAGVRNVGTSISQTVIFTNDQSTKLTISGTQVTGANAADYGAKSNCGTALAAGLHCTITVTFKPLAPLTRTASLAITDSLGTQTVPLTGVATEVKLSSTSLHFGSVTVGQAKSLAVTLTNIGTSAMNIISPGIVITGTAAADYSQTNTCGTTVGAGQSCTVSVTFKPTKSGSRSAALNVNDDGGPSPQKVTLSGTGT